MATTSSFEAECILKSLSSNRYGQSFDSIAQYVQSNFEVEDDFQIHLQAALDELVEQKIIAKDSSGLYKLRNREQASGILKVAATKASTAAPAAHSTVLGERNSEQNSLCIIA